MNISINVTDIENGFLAGALKTSKGGQAHIGPRFYSDKDELIDALPDIFSQIMLKELDISTYPNPDGIAATYGRPY